MKSLCPEPPGGCPHLQVVGFPHPPADAQDPGTCLTTKLQAFPLIKGSMLHGSSLNISKHQFCIISTTGHSSQTMLSLGFQNSLLLANPVHTTCFPGMRMGEPCGTEVKGYDGPQCKVPALPPLRYITLWPVTLICQNSVYLTAKENSLTVSYSLMLALKMRCFSQHE